MEGGGEEGKGGEEKQTTESVLIIALRCASR